MELPVDLAVDPVDFTVDLSAVLDLSSVCNCGHLYPVSVSVSSVSSPFLFCLVFETWYE